MCGIVGYIGSRRAAKILFNGLKRLEYRGYDSAGVAAISENIFHIHKSVGKINDLLKKIETIKIPGTIGIGHTRWATHGKPSDANSHPHTDCKNEFAVVHNGIIENYSDLKNELISQNHVFQSETDTEVIAHLLEKNFNGNFEEAFFKTIKMLTGSFALCAISIKEPDKIICARLGSPLVLGRGEGDNYIASDVLAILKYTRDIVFLDDMEAAVITSKKISVKDFNGTSHKKAVTRIDWDSMISEKKEYKHYMLKEIYEQPDVISETIEDKFDETKMQIKFPYCPIEDDYFKRFQRVYIVACGTAWHAGLIGKYYMEEFCGLSVEDAIASEFRYRSVPIKKDDLILIISQSGETADSLAALRYAKEKGAKSLAVCNVRGSTLARECDGVIYTNAGPEIGVASTKAFTTQITAIFMLTMHIAKLKKSITDELYSENMRELIQIPDKVRKILDNYNTYRELSVHFHRYRDFLFLGRHYNYPIALEGALKLKEISYIHAEGYAAGEMKHGPIALISEDMPVVVIATKSFVTEKVISNLQEVKARDGISIILTNNSVEIPDGLADYSLILPQTIEALAPILNVIPLQIIAYQIADFLGCDVDQPRNLAKSVTVE